ncbi:MAG: amidohydrolase family protein [Promethearchaeota archaeon]
MPRKSISCRFGLIGEELELKEDVYLEIDRKGKIKNVSFESSEEILDLKKEKKNYLMIPGLINAHVHIGDSFAKEMGFNKELKNVVAPPNGLKHLLLKNTSDFIKQEGMKNAMKEMIYNGITCFADFREEGAEGIKLLKEVLEKECLKGIILGRFETFEDLETIFRLASGLGLSSYKAVKTEFKEEIKSLKQKYKKLIACHCAEMKRREDLINRLFNEDLVDIMVHGTHLNEKDLEKIKEKNLSLVFCPRSNGYFGTGFPPINEAVKLEIPISLGTDNVMVNNMNLFEELRYLYRIQRVLSQKHEYETLNPVDMLKMITVNPARALRIDDEMGSLSKGKDANFILIDLNHPNYHVARLNRKNFYPLIIQRTNAENIKKVYLKGKKIHEKP